MTMGGKIVFLTTFCFLLISSLVESNSYIHITCPSCEDHAVGKTGKFAGSLGSDLVIQYTINETTLHLFKLFYNETSEIWWKQNLVKRKNGTDPRLVAEEKAKGNPHILEVTLKGLTWADNGAVFRFDGRNGKLDPAKGQNSVLVTPAKKKIADTSEPVDSDVIVIGIVIGVIIVVMLILMLLLYKGFITLDGCLECCGFGKKSGDDSKPFQWEETDEKVYDAPRNQNGLIKGSPPPQQTEYAALGPGGGRMDKPKDKPPKSDYAQVKTEDVDYPPYVEEADSIIV